MPAIIYDLKAIGGALRKRGIDDWWQPAKPESEPKPAEPIASDDWFDPFSRFNWEGWNTMSDSEVDLQALMCADRDVQNRRRAEQAAIDLEVDKETAPAIRRITRKRKIMSGLVERLHAWYTAGKAITGDVVLYLEAADRIEHLELALVELSQTNGSPSNVADANVLALRVRTTARLALRPDLTDDKINEASKRAPPEDTPAECKVCGASPYQHCFMSGAFQGCPRDLRVLPNPAKDK